MSDALPPEPPDGAFRAGEPVIVFDRKHRGALVFLDAGKRLHLQVGSFEADALIGKLPGARAPTNKGESVIAYRATLEEYVLLMPRAATVVAPKDIGYMLQMGDVFPGAQVVEAGIGSGGLTLGLLRAVGERGHVTAFELREDHANRAVKNVERWREPLRDRLTVRLEDVCSGLAGMSGVDRVILDLPEPWDVVGPAAQALRPGGILLCYLPTVRQVDRLAMAMLDHPLFASPDVAEVWVRPWVVDRTRMRPAMRMVSHTGFLVRSRRRGVRDTLAETLDRHARKEAEAAEGDE